MCRPILAYTTSRDFWLIMSQLAASDNTSKEHSYPNGYLRSICATWAPIRLLHGCIWLTVLTLSLDSHTGAVKRVHSTFIFEFSLGVRTLEITPKPRDSSAEIHKSLLVTKEWNEPGNTSEVMNMLTPEEDEICGKHKGRGLTTTVMARKIWKWSGRNSACQWRTRQRWR